MDLKNESKLLRLRNTFDKNYKITRLYANYLEKAPTFISRDMIDELCSDGALDIKSAKDIPRQTKPNPHYKAQQPLQRKFGISLQ